jgi:hypothetical protein
MESLLLIGEAVAMEWPERNHAFEWRSLERRPDKSLVQNLKFLSYKISMYGGVVYYKLAAFYIWNSRVR